VSLRDLGQIVGFDTHWYALSNAFHIDTHEPNLSDYGRQAAEEFLRPFLTLHGERVWVMDESRGVLLDINTGEEIEMRLPFSQDRNIVQRYDLFDLTGDGIPAVVLHWDYWAGSRWGAGQFLYVYQDGGFAQIAELGMHVFYRSSQGEIFLYIDHCLGYCGSGRRTLHSVVLDDGNPRLELLISSEWDGQSGKHVFYVSEELLYMDEEALRSFVRNAPVFSVPGRPDEPLFPLRPFTFAHLDD